MKENQHEQHGGSILPYFRQTFLIMRLSLFFLVISTAMTFSAHSYSQNAKLSLNLKDATVKEVIRAIETQSEYLFLYREGEVDLDRRVSVRSNAKLLKEVLDELFKGTENTYIISDTQVVIGKAPEKALGTELTSSRKEMKTEIEQPQQKEISGKITDTRGEPLAGATILVKGSTIGTVTDAEGQFSLRIPANAETLQISFVGMITQEIPAAGRNTFNVSLAEDAIGLEEVVAVGYGSIRKSDLTGSVSVLRGDDIAYKATANVAQALQGKVAGVQVVNSGEPGSNPVIRIRGLGSVRSGTEPLYVVDGVLTNNISFLGNNDIESMTVLKDASASAIYGVRAANGVIIITTKRGKGEKININYTGYMGFQVPVNVMKMASTTEYLTLLNEKGTIAAKKTGGEFTPYNPADYPVSIDWFNEILRSSASVQDHHIGFSGGNEKTTFALGAGYFSQEGLMKFHDYERINLRSSVESKVRKYLKVGLTANFSSSYTNNSPNVAHDAFVAPPPIPVIDAETGYYNALTEFGDYNNPMVSLVFNNDKTNGLRIVASAFAEVYLLRDLTFKSSLGVDGSYIRDRKYLPKYTLNRKGGEPYVEDREQLERKMTYNVDTYWDNTLTYTREFGEGHHLTALAGISAQEQKGLWMSAARLHVPQSVDKDGRLLNTTLYLNLGDPGSQTNNDEGSHVASFSWFGRLNYAYKEKYLFTGTLRRDGSSIFPTENRYDIFPSVGLGWVLSNEEFMKEQPAFQLLKLRASWGEMGNNKIPELTAVSTVDYGNWNSSEFGGVIQQGASATYIGPANLLWEKTREYDFAIEGASLQSRLSFEFDFYHKKTIGAIFPVTVNSALGASNASYLDNNADVVNKGVELSLSWKNNYRDFNYRVGGNVTLNDNEVVALKPGTIGIYGGFMNVVSSTYTTLGHPIGEFYGRNVLGIFQNDAEIANYKNSEGTPIQPDAQPGDFRYEDINGDGVINDKDRTFLGTALPTYSYGLNFYFEYKGIDLVVDLYGQGGNHIYNAKRFRQIGNENYDKDFFDNRWHGEGTSTTYPSADLASADNKVVNSWAIEKGDFFRIQNIQLGYTLPETVSTLLGIGSIRLFANATNPFTFFKYKGFSPEIIKTGAESATNQGVDSYVYPMSATYNFGLNINL